MSSASAALASDDPTGSTQKRETLQSEFDRRWRRLRGRIREHLQNNRQLRPSADRSEARRVSEFRTWLEQEIDRTVVEPLTPTSVQAGMHYTGSPIRESVLLGIVLGTAHLRRAGIDVDSRSYNDAEILLQEQRYQDILQRRYQDTYDDLNDAAEQTHTDVSRTYRGALAAGIGLSALLTGENASEDGLNNRVDKAGQTSTQRIANNHVVGAVNDSAVQTYRDADVEEVGVIAETDGGTGEISPDTVEWVTAQDHRVCLECRSLTINSPYSIDDAPQPPQHPNCRCMLVPSVRSGKEPN